MDIMSNLITEITSGDWGKEFETDGLVECNVIRGTDFQSLVKKDFTNVPKRFIRKSSLEKRILHDGDILVELSGGSKDQPTGRVLLITEQLLTQTKHKLLYSNFVKRLEVNSARIHPKFLEYFWSFLYVNGVTRIYEKRTTGIRNFKLSDFLEKECVPLPPLPEQKSIAHILSTVQRAKEATEQVIQATKELKKSLMKHLFTYGPVSLEEAPNVKLKETEIGMVPEEWEVIPLGRLADVKGGKRLPKGHEFAKAATRYPYIRVTDLRENGVNIKDLKYLTKGDADLLTRYIINSSDVYISIAGTIGLVGVVPEELNGANLTENCARIIINDDSTLDKNFLFRYLSSEEGQNSISIRTSKTSQPKLALIRIKQIPLAVPSLEEQKRISHYLKIIDVKISTNGDRLIALDELFKTLLNNLMTGKIRVKNFEVPKA